MPATVYYTATTLDGFVADADGSLDWLLQIDDDPDPGGFADFFARVGAMAMGATTYEWVVAHEDLVGSPEKWRQWYGDTPCWVLTHRDLPAITGAALTFARGDVAPVHAAMAAAAGQRTLWIVGGGDLAGQFADAGLLDEIVADVAPVTLGGGAPLLPRRLTSERLELLGVEHRGRFARLRYRVRPPGAAGS
jgi:dihydrofolate reductase